MKPFQTALIVLTTVVVTAAMTYKRAWTEGRNERIDTDRPAVEFFQNWHAQVMAYQAELVQYYRIALANDHDKLAQKYDNSNQVSSALHNIGAIIGTRQKNLGNLVNAIARDSASLDSAIYNLQALRHESL